MSDGESIAGREREVTFHTPGALTREQVEQVLCRFGIDVRAEWRDDWRALAHTDAALRATIEQQAQELEKLKGVLGANEVLVERLSAMTRERDAIAKARFGDKYAHPILDACKRRDEAHQQLAASQARCREMERDKEQAVYALGQLEEKYLQLQATLAEAQSRITDLETDVRSWKEDWQLEVTEHHKTKATLAAREARIQELEAGDSSPE